MTETEAAILNALKELDRAIVSLATAEEKPNLLPIFAKIDSLAATLPPGTDPTFLHYLKKKSYEKAKLYLLGRDAENQVGNCRHVH